MSSFYRSCIDKEGFELNCKSCHYSSGSIGCEEYIFVNECEVSEA
jgi:hypothetical protein